MFEWAEKGQWTSKNDENVDLDSRKFRIGFEPLFVDYTQKGSLYVSFLLFEWFAFGLIAGERRRRVESRDIISTLAFWDGCPLPCVLCREMESLGLSPSVSPAPGCVDDLNPSEADGLIGPRLERAVCARVCLRVWRQAVSCPVGIFPGYTSHALLFDLSFLFGKKKKPHENPKSEIQTENT